MSVVSHCNPDGPRLAVAVSALLYPFQMRSADMSGPLSERNTCLLSFVSITLPRDPGCQGLRHGSILAFARRLFDLMKSTCLLRAREPAEPSHALFLAAG